MQKCENYYESICQKLKFTKFNFWTWKNRCKIYIYLSQAEYINHAGRPEWSHASANFKERRIDAFLSEQGFESNLIPHEMGHLLFREITGGKTQLPLWLEEGVACYVEEEQCRRLEFATNLASHNLLIPIEKLTDINADTLVVPELFYAESASIVNYLIAGFDQYKFLKFCAELKARKNWWRSLKNIYGFENFEDMDKKWKEYLKKQK
ncbi:MAG: peptidase MA family metallohydrolase [Candidatus Omnitrophota bacterium]